MAKNSNSSHENDIQKVDSPFHKDFKSMDFSQEGTARKFRENNKNREINCYANYRLLILTGSTIF